MNPVPSSWDLGSPAETFFIVKGRSIQSCRADGEAKLWSSTKPPNTPG